MTDEAVEKAWKAREAEQRRAWLALSYSERLHWLEEAKRFCALALGAARRKRRRDEPA
jgi:hypothetical protein